MAEKIKRTRNRKNKYTTESYAELLKPRGILVLSEYKTYEHTFHKCEKCGFEWGARASQVLRGRGCRKCAIETVRKKNTRTPEQYLEEIAGKNISPLEPYKGVQIKIPHRCDICLNVWDVSPNSIIQGHGCMVCANEGKKTTHEGYLEKLKDRPFKVVDTYQGAFIAINHQCNVCGGIWQAKPCDVVKGSGCHHCAESGFKSHLPGFLYMLLSGDGSYLKIGITNNLDRRFSELKRFTPFKWDQIYSTSGDGTDIYELEQNYHRIFADYRADFAEKFDGYTEWFRFEGAVKSIINRLLANTQEAA